ncbi:hypothetical protein [Absidia glauca]|uniref:Reverse transcriptase domain-containing protein n=1 Tax=Absidia glauca TaxID=4829 RepID=A0A163J0H9_ABSGL|nr:hypothetical protein [Absidia glauca]
MTDLLESATAHITPTTMETLSTALVQAITDALDLSVGRRLPSPRQSSFWTDDMLKTVHERERCFQRWRKATGIRKLELWLALQRAKAVVRRHITNRRRQTWRDFCLTLDNSDLSKVTAKIKKIRTGRTIKPTFSHPLGHQQAADTMATHFQHTFSGHLLTPPASPMPPPHVASPSPHPFTPDDIASTISALPRKKAPGIDSIISKVLQPIINPLSSILHLLFQICWQSGLTPVTWRTAQVIPIYKKHDPTDPSNYRPISLTVKV